MVNEKLKFVGCDTCAVKDGTHTLCYGCLHNRNAIFLLAREYLIKVGDSIDKKEGTKFPGIVVVLYQNLDGKEFAVCELPDLKLQHIYRVEQLMLRK